MKVVALAGGTGSSKLLRGLSKLEVDLTVICNVGDNYWVHGVYVCPDLDIAMYTLAGVEDRAKGWGVRGDTFRTLSQLARIGRETWFKLGDKDLATSLSRTGRVREGLSLTSVTDELRHGLGVKARLLPASDDPLETRIVTSKGTLHLQEFWVRDGGRPKVMGVDYHGAAKTRPTPECIEAIEDADRVVVCPGNPVTSIGAILSVPGMTGALSVTSARGTALSPMVGSKPVSGPAGVFMGAVGMRSDSVGVARSYSGFIDSIVIDKSDSPMKREIEAMGVACVLTDALMRKAADEVRLARLLIES